MASDSPGLNTRLSAREIAELERRVQTFKQAASLLTAEGQTEESRMRLLVKKWKRAGQEMSVFALPCSRGPG